MTQISQLAEELIFKADKSVNQRVVVLIYGPPGSGKSTIAGQLVNLINEKTACVPGIKCDSKIPYKVYTGFGGEQTQICEYRDEKVCDDNIPLAIHLQMDGFHLPLSKLTPELVQRRGCHESFDAKLVVQLCDLLSNSDWSSLSIPDFDHEIKDPTNPGIRLNANSKIVVLEGLYLMLDVSPWNQIPELVKKLKNTDYPVTIVRIDGGNTEELSARVAKRHFKCGLVNSYEEGLAKYYANDIHNAKVVVSQSMDSLADYIIDNKKNV